MFSDEDPVDKVGEDFIFTISISTETLDVEQLQNEDTYCMEIIEKLQRTGNKFKRMKEKFIVKDQTLYRKVTILTALSFTSAEHYLFKF